MICCPVPFNQIWPNLMRGATDFSPPGARFLVNHFWSVSPHQSSLTSFYPRWPVLFSDWSSLILPPWDRPSVSHGCPLSLHPLRSTVTQPQDPASNSSTRLSCPLAIHRHMSSTKLVRPTCPSQPRRVIPGDSWPRDTISRNHSWRSTCDGRR